MSDVLIRAEGLGKKYTIGHQAHRERYTALRDVVARGARSFARRASDILHGRPVVEGDELEEVWALRDVDFEVKRGHVLGIIGRNGAGKSTLLKILSRITEPTTGRVTLRGRVASLLEVGTGFHPELTGRENIFLNGAVLGMSREEIRRRFDEIVAFAEIERFLDTPVKRYSSGMYVRLAFAVAAHLEPEILIVDEVLAVGDLEFQRKCLGKMQEVSTRQGRTVLFVSHNMATVEALCEEVLLLVAGQVSMRGGPREVTGAYLKGAMSLELDSPFQPKQLAPTLTLDYFGVSPSPVESGTGAEFTVHLSSPELMRFSELVILIHSALGVRVAILDLRGGGVDLMRGKTGSLKLRSRVDSLPLVEGDYSLGLYVAGGVIRADFLDLARLTMARSIVSSEIPPYAVEYRGLVELGHEVSAE